MVARMMFCMFVITIFAFLKSAHYPICCLTSTLKISFLSCLYELNLSNLLQTTAALKQECKK